MIVIKRQIVFHPLCESNPNGQFTNPDGSRWSYARHGTQKYDDQFREGFVSGNYALLRWPIGEQGGDGWTVAELTGEYVDGSLGRLPVCYMTGAQIWTQISRKFAQLTGETIPDDWRDL